MTTRIIPAIMSGGAGTRLWPLSTKAAPKQYHAVVGERSLFSRTLARVSGAAGALSFAPPIVICAADHAELAAAHLGDTAPLALALEPAPRNTAAAAAVAAKLAQDFDREALVLLLPSDHLVADIGAFHRAIERAAPVARERIVTFGIRPDRPATGYGYIKQGAALGNAVFAIDAFHEKPDSGAAASYLAAGGYSWNAGMFLFAPETLLGEFDAAPAIRTQALAALAGARRTGARIELDPETFAQTPALSLDVAVMERTARGAVAPCDIGWADVGAWDEVWRLSPHDAAGNATSGAVVQLDGSDNLLHADGVTLCVAGVSGLVVVATRDAVLVVPRERAQDVKALGELVAKR